MSSLSCKSDIPHNKKLTSGTRESHESRGKFLYIHFFPLKKFKTLTQLSGNYQDIKNARDGRSSPPSNITNPTKGKNNLIHNTPVRPIKLNETKRSDAR